MSNFKDMAGPRGIFTLKVFSDTGEPLDFFQDENLVTTTGREGLAQMLAGDVALVDGPKNIQSGAFGTNPAAATLLDAALSDAVLKELTAIDYPTQNSVMFSFSLELTEGNGLAIQEFGLITGDGSLFARKVRETAINKTSVIRLEVDWQIIF